MARNMSQSEINRRKKAQAHISQATGALGLAALGTRLGAKGPAKVAAKYPKIVRGEFKLTPDKMKDTSNALATTGAGIGGAGSFNFASYSSAESRQRKAPVIVPPKKKVRKAYPGEFVGVSKIGEWKTIDQRERTQMRDRKVQRRAGAVAVGGGALAVGAVTRRPGALEDTIQAGKKVKSTYQLSRKLGRTHGTSLKTAGKGVEGAVRRQPDVGLVGGGAAAVGAASAVGAGAKTQQSYQQHKINERRRARVKKNDNVSAFGIPH